MQLVEKYAHQPLVRNTPLGGIRHYVCPRTGRKLPSVTAILDHTADKSGLIEWRRRVGDKKADEIKNEALGLGTLMHTHLEHFIAGTPRPTGNNLIRLQAETMADQIIEQGLVNISECWGSEIGVYMPGLYAGTADGLGLWNDIPCVFDFKTARKMKKREHIEDYLIQLCAYATAFNELHQANIETGVIFMVDRDFNYQEFVLDGAEFARYQDKWLDRLDQYYEITA
jgi:hypothetical protein